MGRERRGSDSTIMLYKQITISIWVEVLTLQAEDANRRKLTYSKSTSFDVRLASFSKQKEYSPICSNCREIVSGDDFRLLNRPMHY